MEMNAQVGGTTVERHEVKDGRTNQVVKVCKSKQAARKVCARMNQNYGACRYTYNGVAL